MDVKISEEPLLPLPSDRDCVFSPSTSIKKTKSLSPDTKAGINAQEKGFQILKKYREGIKYSGMNQIIPNLFVGSLHDSLDDFQLTKYKIKRIVSIMTTFPQNDPPQHKNIKVLRIKIEDSSSEDVINHFPPVCEFIHAARLENEAVLIHCFMGISRGVCFCAAYLMVITSLSYSSVLALISGKRLAASPNIGFRMQLRKFSLDLRHNEYQRLLYKFDKQDGKFLDLFKADKEATSYFP